MRREIPSSLRARLAAERLRWQWLSGWLGGGLMLAMAASAILFGWVMFLYLLVEPIRVYGEVKRGALTSAAAFAIGATLLGAVLAIIVVRRQRQEHALLRLAPNVEPLMVGLNVRLGLAALLCLPPAIALPTLTTFKYVDSLDVIFSLADVPRRDFLLSGLMFVYLAAIIVATFGWLRAPLRFAGFSIYLGAIQVSEMRLKWLPLVACVIIVIGHRIWLRTEMGQVVRINPTERRQQLSLIERFRSRRLQGAARVMGARSSSHRITALLSTQISAPFTLLTVCSTAMYITVAPGVFDAFVGGRFFAYLVLAWLATPTPIPLGPVMLLPLGAERHNVGRILMSVWMRDVRFRLLLGVALGLILRVLCWWLEPFGFMRPPFFVEGDAWTLLVWTPLMQAASLYGAAYALCWAISASPRLMAKPRVLAILPMFAVLSFCAVGGALGWGVAAIFPVLDSRDMSSLRFIIVNAAIFPLLAWGINRRLRSQWLNANLGAISSAMQAWAAQRRKFGITGKSDSAF